MKVVDISKWLMVTYTFLTSPLGGIGFLGYVLYADKRLKNLENQIRAAIAEDEEGMLTKDLEDFEIKGNVSNFNIHEDCIIENYQNRFYRILKPDGKYLPKIFLTMEQAKKEIDLVAPFFPKTPAERSKIYNIRYVK